ncbi:porin [Halorhodospira neutriphila]|nr:porin [Halorhodospira neutriphila]
MRRQLITAAAAATALAAPGAVLADEGPTVYGFVNLSVDYEGYDGAPGSEDGDVAMNTGLSHFGFRGSETLDNGMEAIYQAEVGWTYTGDSTGTPGENGGTLKDGNDNTVTLAGEEYTVEDDWITQSRDSFVGLRGDFGQVTFGRQSAANQFVYDGPGKEWVAQVGTPAGAIHMGMPSRYNNMVRYNAPGGQTAGGGEVDAQLSFVPSEGEEPGDHIYNARASYSQGPASGAVSLWHAKDASAPLPEGDNTVASLAARYDLGFVQLGAQASGRDSDASDADDMAYSLGMSAPFGDGNRVKAIVTQLSADADDSDYTTAALGYDRILSERTELRFAVASTFNDKNSGPEGEGVTPHDYGAYGPSSGVTPAKDETHTTLSANLRHSF